MHSNGASSFLDLIPLSKQYIVVLNNGRYARVNERGTDFVHRISSVRPQSDRRHDASLVGFPYGHLRLSRRMGQPLGPCDA